MALSISVHDFRGCDRATIEVSPIALVAGLNGAGKSSILRAAASAVSGRVLPPGILKKDATALVRAGMSSSSVTVKGEGGTCRATWPSADAAIEGSQPPSATPIAAGLETVLHMDDKTRARTLAEYMHADPSREDLYDALRDADLTAEKLVEAWKQVEVHGWDGAAEQYKLDGSAAKRDWERLTGEKYGSAKAAGWAPLGWTPEDNTDQLQGAVEKARAGLERAVRAEAVGADRIERLAEQADRLDGLKRTLNALKVRAANAEAEADLARAALNALPAVPGNENVTTCACCGVALAVRVIGPERYLLERVDPVDDAAKAAYQQATDAARAKLSETTSLANQLSSEVRSTEASIAVAQKAKNEIGELTSAPDMVEVVGTVDEARAALDQAETRLRGAAVKVKADSLRDEVTALTAIVKALAPDGVRKRKLIQAVEAFNSTVLLPLCETAGWKPVVLTESLGVAYGGRPYALLSDSEQYRVRVTLQIAMARLDGSSLVIIDGAEILDPAGRNGLFALLAGTGLPALVGMTVGGRSKAPDLSAYGLGLTYWIDAGQCRAVGEKEAA